MVPSLSPKLALRSPFSATVVVTPSFMALPPKKLIDLPQPAFESHQRFVLGAYVGDERSAREGVHAHD